MVAPSDSSAAPPTQDAWPHTRRPLPWLIAGFLAALFLVPIDAIHLKVNLPFSSDFDRFLVAVMFATWAIGGVLGRGQGVIKLRPRGWAAATIAFVFIALLSLAVHVSRITNLGQWDVAQKRFAVLLAMIAVFVVFTMTLRVAELRPFSVLIVVLAMITAAGTICEKHTGYNVFYSTATAAFSPIASVDPAPTEIDPAVETGRPTISGPTRHPLSVTTLLGMALPFAVVLAAVAPTTRRRLLWILAAGLIVAGAQMTERKSGVVVPAFALLTLFILRPRQLLRLAPYGIAALVFAVAMAPGMFGALEEFGQADSQTSTAGRTADYPAIVPDVLTNPLVGRGYGTLDSIRVDETRILDNEYLGQLWQVGGLGLLAFLAMIVTPLVVIRTVFRSDDPRRGPPALAAGAACLAFGVATALYDILSFPQAPYLFFFMAAMCTCAATVELPAPERQEPAPVGGRLLASGAGA